MEKTKTTTVLEIEFDKPPKQEDLDDILDFLEHYMVTQYPEIHGTIQTVNYYTEKTNGTE